MSEVESGAPDSIENSGYNDGSQNPLGDASESTLQGRAEVDRLQVRAELDRLQVRAELVLDRRVNFALQQNDVPVVKVLKVTSLHSEIIENVSISLEADPLFASPWVGMIPRLAPSQTFNFDAVDIALSPSFLVNLSEAMTGLLWLEVKIEGETVLSRMHRLELLGYDQWGGLGSPWEMLAAFVFPDHPEVDQALGRATQILDAWTGDSSFDGYASKDPRRVFTVAASIYHAVAGRGYSSIALPDEYTKWGAKIRTPERLVKSGIGTSLDMSLFLCGAFEQAQLNPIIVFLEDRVLVGVWQTDDSFPTPSIDDISSLRKRVELDEISLLDTSCLLRRPPEDFESSIDSAKPWLKNAQGFLGCLDIRRCRISQIRPLPQRAQSGPYEVVKEQWGDDVREIEIPKAPEISVPSSGKKSLQGSDESEDQALVSSARLDGWKRKLLDLTLRNRLLNHRDSKKTIPILCPNLSGFEDALAEGAVFSIHSKPDVMKESGRSEELHLERTGEEALDAFLREELDQKRLFADLGEDELERRLIETYRAARLSLEETGANTLFLAVGMLSWRETPTSPKERRAPILLYPVELERQSVRKGFRIRSSDDEIRVNVTLLEMLTNDFHLPIEGLELLPEDDSGIDVAHVLRGFRQLVKDMEKWEVLEEACLGHFSFTKFLMWRDLQERSEDLAQNQVVDHLIHRPAEAFPDQGPFPEPGEIDKTTSVEDILCPMSADSSQLAALMAAADDKSFVLEGPPGTGKSQTITNTIAHCLAMGKTVLFVSEKMAALNVVHKRLDKIGLGPFCLELHSNKTRKKEVIRQLGEALNAKGQKSRDDFAREAKRLQALRGELNDYVNVLHRPRDIGLSAYEVLTRLIYLADTKSLDVDVSALEGLDRDRFESWRDLVSRLATSANTVGPLRSHSLRSIGHDSWSPSWEKRFGIVVEALEKTLTENLEATVDFADDWAIENEQSSRARWKDMGQLAFLMKDPPSLPKTLLVESSWDHLKRVLSQWIERGKRRGGVQGKLLSKYTERVFSLDAKSLTRDYEEARKSFFPLSWFRMRKLKNRLASASRDQHKVSTEEVATHLEWARLWSQEDEALSSDCSDSKALLGAHWKSQNFSNKTPSWDTSWDDLEKAVEWVDGIRLLALRLSGDDLDKASILREKWAKTIDEGRELLASTGSLGGRVQRMIAARESWEGALDEAARELSLDLPKVLGDSDEEGFLRRMTGLVEGWKNRETSLRDWCAWRSSRGLACQEGLSFLVEGLEKDAVTPQELDRVFEKSLLQRWIERTTEQEAPLRSFTSSEQERKMSQFREVDKKIQALTESLIFATLAELVPLSNGPQIESSEMGILSRELQKKTRHLPVRKLLNQIPHLLTRLKPCLLMSPLSVAQYLDSGQAKFDLVIFDEASQIPVWDAIGAIARGRRTLIVGDPKQLPPTSFFSKTEGQEYQDEEAVEDLESILDDCIGARLPWLSLNWHYRSRHESLIAFSNYHYYDNRLFTFPSPQREGLGVRMRLVEGVYDKGRSRTNRKEAEAVVQEIKERFKDPSLNKSSLGIVTFSQPQQTLIEDLLDEACRENADFEVWMRSGSEEGEALFVKNLENVQGDERDVILFSIGYGPDSEGRVSMNFGPLNRDGGERRLNVAVTRARREVLVFTTLRADQIDLVRTRARGVRDLKAFLEYADRGPLALAEATESETSSPDAFLLDLQRSLLERGYESDLLVGCSGYRVDLAIRHPDDPTLYLLGVECDGPNYGKAHSARDRDCLRHLVLNALGWRLVRVWAFDWWTDGEGELARLLIAVEEAKSSFESKVESHSAESCEDEVVEDSGSLGSSDAVSIAESDETNSLDSGDGKTPLTPDEESIENLDEHSSSIEESISLEAQVTTQEYVILTGVRGSPSDFHEQDQKVRDVILEVMELEAPLSHETLTRRVVSLFEVKRVIASIRERIEALIPMDGYTRLPEGESLFLWKSGHSPTDLRVFRVPGDEKESRRKPFDIPTVEVALAVLSILKQQISLPREVMEKEAGKLFGYPRANQDMSLRVKDAIDHLEQLGECQVDGESLICPR